MYNRNQGRDDDRAANLGGDDAQANMAGKGGLTGHNP